MVNTKLYWPKISIVTPSYNQGKFIEQTILSVINQNYPNLEYIIIDGGSTDETVSIIKKYEKYITYWISEKDNGQSHAINKGLEKCTGEIFNWLNSDDWYEPDALFNVAKAFIYNKSALFVSGYENHVYENGDTLLYKGTFLNDNLLETIERCEIAQPSTFFKLSTIRSVGKISTELDYLMDAELWIRLLLNHGQNEFKKIDKLLVNFRYHTDSKSFSNISNNHFWYEKSGIIAHFQQHIGVPKFITNYYVFNIYQTPEFKLIHTEWKFNNSVVASKKLKIYFIKKYIIKQLIFENDINAKRGIKELIKNLSIDFFLLKSCIKLIFKNKFIFNKVLLTPRK